MEARLIRVEEGLKTVANDLGEIKTALKDIASAMKTLAVLEEKHTTVSESIKRAFKAIDDIGGRVVKIETAMPNILLASGWVFKAAIGVLALLGTVAGGVIVRGFTG